MPDVNHNSEFAKFYHMYKQWEAENHPALEASQLQTELPHVRKAAHPLLQSGLPPHRPYPYQPTRNVFARSTPLGRNTPDLLAFFQALDEVKKRQDDLNMKMIKLQNMSEQIRITVEEGVTAMKTTMERFEVVGRNVLEIALKSSSTQLPDMEQPISYPHKPYEGPNTSRTTSSDPPQTNFNLRSSETVETYSEPNYADYSSFEFLNNDAS
ncbi:hypothetical protein B0O99DRAFT_694598 [Bisporella sp. PMI_857]|nr:hypothetical protein B0O99DRAFT_694598 [Bisporella sp. PMI_857]